MIQRIVSISIFISFLFFSLFVKFFGLKNYVFSNHQATNAYVSFNKIAKEELTPDIHAIILIPNKQLKVIKIFKTPIGKVKIGNQEKAIDSIGNLYNQEEGNLQNLIIVEGDYKKWAKFYQKLTNTSVLPEIYKVELFEHTANIWVHPGVLVQIDNQILNLEEFYKTFPKLFKKGNMIDLRSTNRVGVSKFKNI